MLAVFAFLYYAAPAQVQRKIADSGKIKEEQAKSEMNGQENVVPKSQKLKMVKELNLTKEQKGSLKELRQTNQAKRDLIESDTSLSENEKKEKLKAVKIAAAIDLQSILTADQKAKLRTMRNEKSEGDLKTDTLN
jgi:Spy/CpxP family protein refolding chaperone